MLGNLLSTLRGTEAEMPNPEVFMKTLIIASAVSLAVGGLIAGVSRAAPSSHSSATDSAGNLHVPDDYQKLYQFLGAWAVASDGVPGSKQMHYVYASPGAVEAYKRNGHFPDGTVLVKEVYGTDTAPMTTGTVSHAQTLKGWFVMVRDTHQSHLKSKLWGDGWGWSWFDAGNRSKTTSVDYKANCLGCHTPAKATDWVYTQGYPSLAAERR